MIKPALIPSDQIPLSPKQTFQQQFLSEDDIPMQSPKIRKLQPRHVSHRRCCTNDEMGDLQFVTPSGVRPHSKVYNIFRTNNGLDYNPGVNTPYGECSSSNYPISRCYSGPMDREPSSWPLGYPALVQNAPGSLVNSCSQESDTADVVISGHDMSPQQMRGSWLNDSYTRNHVVGLYDGLSFEQAKREFMYSTSKIHHKPKQTLFDWEDSPVITRMRLYGDSQSLYEKGLPYLPRLPSWSTLIKPDNNIELDPLPYTRQLDQFHVDSKTDQSLLKVAIVKEEIFEENCDESSVNIDMPQLSLPNIIDPYGRSAGGGDLSALTTPNCDTSYEFASSDGEVYGSP